MFKQVKDERIVENNQTALAYAAVTGQSLLLIKILFQMITGVATIQSIGWELLVFFAMEAVKFFHLYRSKTIRTPTSLFGEPLTTGGTGHAKKVRFYKAYIYEGFFLATAFSLGSYFRSGYYGLAPTIVLFMIYFILSLAGIYFWREHQLKRYKQDLEA